MRASSQRFQDVVASSRADRDRVVRLVNSRQWQRAEPDPTRFRRFIGRRASLEAPRGAEALQGDTVDFQAVSFLTEGALVRRAVAYVEVSVPGRSEAGTGFLVSPALFLTNQHVIPDLASAHGAQIVFDREMGEAGQPRPTTSFVL